MVTKEYDYRLVCATLPIGKILYSINIVDAMFIG